MKELCAKELAESNKTNTPVTTPAQLVIKQKEIEMAVKAVLNKKAPPPPAPEAAPKKEEAKAEEKKSEDAAEKKADAGPTVGNDMD